MVAGLLVLTCLGALAAANCLMGSRAGASPDPGGRIGAEDPCPVDWDYWLAVNPDIVAWIEIPGTAISQPVVQARVDDPTYYLSHDVRREWNLYGCPYVDAGCDLGIDSWSVVISGHNIDAPPAMFHDLVNFHDPEFLAGHRDVVLYTPHDVRRLRVVGAKIVLGQAKEKVTEFATERDFLTWRNEKLSEFNEPPDENLGQMLTLCSCSYFFNPRDERTLVFARWDNNLVGYCPKTREAAGLGQ